jgi:hypothetical protein
MKHTSDTVAIRMWELRKAGKSEAEIAKELTDELSREATGFTPQEIHDAVVEAEELFAASQFVSWAGDAWYGSEANRQLLEDRAHEYDGIPYSFSGLTAAFQDLIDEGLLESRPAPAPTPAPAPAPAPARTRTVKKSGLGGTLTVDPETRAELNKLSLDELKRRANVDRWVAMDPKRASRLRQGFEVI